MSVAQSHMCRLVNTLTYEDVTNVDSVGIVTARSGGVTGGRYTNAVTNHGLHWMLT